MITILANSYRTAIFLDWQSCPEPWMDLPWSWSSVKSLVTLWEWFDIVECVLYCSMSLTSSFVETVRNLQWMVWDYVTVLLPALLCFKLNIVREINQHVNLWLKRYEMKENRKTCLTISGVRCTPDFGTKCLVLHVVCIHSVSVSSLERP